MLSSFSEYLNSEEETETKWRAVSSADLYFLDCFRVSRLFQRFVEAFVEEESKKFNYKNYII